LTTRKPDAVDGRPALGDDVPAIMRHVLHLRAMFEDWPHAVYVLNGSGQYVYQNAVDRAAFGDLKDMAADDLDTDAATQEAWAIAHSSVLSGETVSYTVQRTKSAWAGRDAEVTMTPLKDGEAVIGILGMTIDRSDAGKFERELQAAAEIAHKTSARLERLTDNVPGGIFEFLIDACGKMSFPYVNSGMGPLLGTTTEALLQDADAGFIHDHPEDKDLIRQAIERSFETLEPVGLSHRLNHPDLGLRWHRIQASPTHRPDGSVIWHGCIFDVTEEMARAAELEAARNQMEALSLVDPLTGIPNRRAFDQAMAERYAQPEHRMAKCTIIRIDLDHFKAVNDTLGHAAGDAVLCRVGACLREVTGEADFTARLGGDEFAIMLAPGRTETDAKKMIDRFRDLIAVPLIHDGRLCRFDASFGIASAMPMPADPMEVLSFADVALLHAKNLGRGRTEVFTSALQHQTIYQRRRGTELRLGLERDEFEPFFQPQFDARSGTIKGFEVLARWRHPDHGFLSPSHFMPIAEDLKIIQNIDRVLFEKVGKVLDRLETAGFPIPRLSFNVSTARASNPDIIKSVQQVQDRGTQVTFELLERILLEDDNHLITHHLDDLRQSGVSIEVDDFGSGRASIVGVLRVAPDALKIDRRLVTPMLGDKVKKGIVQAIVEFGQSLDISVTAGGVETPEHARVLRDMGCKTLQGVALARPMTEAELTDYLSSCEATATAARIRAYP